MQVFTGCNEVVAKVMFLLEFVIVFTGGSASVHVGIPPWEQSYPLEQSSPKSRYPPGAGTPQGQIPPRADPHKSRPPRRQTLAYGQRAAGKHPTGMHSCCILVNTCRCSLKINAQRDQKSPGH